MGLRLRWFRYFPVSGLTRLPIPVHRLPAWSRKRPCLRWSLPPSFPCCSRNSQRSIPVSFLLLHERPRCIPGFQYQDWQHNFPFLAHPSPAEWHKSNPHRLVSSRAQTKKSQTGLSLRLPWFPGYSSCRFSSLLKPWYRLFQGSNNQCRNDRYFLPDRATMPPVFLFLFLRFQHRRLWSIVLHRRLRPGCFHLPLISCFQSLFPHNFLWKR